jgi:hypothetical protein
MNVDRVRELAEALGEKATPHSFDWSDCTKCVAAWCVALFEGEQRRSFDEDLESLLGIDAKQAGKLYVGWQSRPADLFYGAHDHKRAAEMLEGMADEYERLG